MTLFENWEESMRMGFKNLSLHSLSAIAEGKRNEYESLRHLLNKEINLSRRSLRSQEIEVILTGLVKFAHALLRTRTTADDKFDENAVSFSFVEVSDLALVLLPVSVVNVLIQRYFPFATDECQKEMTHLELRTEDDMKHGKRMILVHIMKEHMTPRLSNILKLCVSRCILAETITDPSQKECILLQSMRKLQDLQSSLKQSKNRCFQHLVSRLDLSSRDFDLLRQRLGECANSQDNNGDNNPELVHLHHLIDECSPAQIQSVYSSGFSSGDYSASEKVEFLRQEAESFHLGKKTELFFRLISEKPQQHHQQQHRQQLRQQQQQQQQGLHQKQKKDNEDDDHEKLENNDILELKRLLKTMNLDRVEQTHGRFIHKRPALVYDVLLPRRLDYPYPSGKPSVTELLETLTTNQPHDSLLKQVKSFCTFGTRVCPQTLQITEDAEKLDYLRSIAAIGSYGIVGKAVNLGLKYEAVRPFHLSPVIVWSQDSEDEVKIACLLMIALSSVRNVAFVPTTYTEGNTVFVMPGAANGKCKLRKLDMNIVVHEDGSILSERVMDKVLRAMKKKADVHIE